MMNDMTENYCYVQRANILTIKWSWVQSGISKKCANSLVKKFRSFIHNKLYKNVLLLQNKKLKLTYFMRSECSLFWGGFLKWVLGGFFKKWVYSKKPPGFFGYVPGCLNPGFKCRGDASWRPLATWLVYQKQGSAKMWRESGRRIYVVVVVVVANMVLYLVVVVV